jgi:hypothetical protein
LLVSTMRSTSSYSVALPTFSLNHPNLARSTCPTRICRAGTARAVRAGNPGGPWTDVEGGGGLPPVLPV